MPIHHVGLSCNGSTFKAMRDFYVAILAPLGYTIFMEKENVFVAMQHPASGPDLWIHTGGDPNLAVVKPEDYSTKERRDAQDVRTHLAFSADSQRLVDEWYDVAIKAGGIDNGKPGLRPEYTPTYYGAFVIDPLGNNVEAVHLPRVSNQEQEDKKAE